METVTSLYVYPSEHVMDSPTLASPSGDHTMNILPCKDIGMSYEAIAGVKTTYTEKLGVSCQICGCMSSGFHYGAYTCEGCKAFFHRCIKKNIIYQQCGKGKNCRANIGPKYKCRVCRYQKCVQVGMSIGAIRVGRMPNTEREKLRANRKNTNGDRRRQLDISDIITTNFSNVFYKSSLFEANNNSINNPINDDYSGFVISKLDTFGFHQLGVINLYQEMLVPMIKDAIKFAKKLPGFLDLQLTDRVALMKHGAFSVCILMMYGSFTGQHVQLKGTQTSLYLTKEAIINCFEAQLLLGNIIQLSERIHQLNFHKTELALFAAIILLSDSPLLVERDRIRSIADDVARVMQMELGHIRSQNKDTFLSFLALKEDLQQASTEFINNMKNGFCSLPEDECEAHLLLKEIFDI
ncbi:peroxisome proliferator-activated receptor gamma-like [Ylistrum balloti]|uniref:peroxisome proliferator-activated receptor gamma-like n=1 Tax=Ylistrum balloti TaxID=509963 RepID=UPI002905CBF6|nr:peroxisome proliferator-activated receptor gamma-like [Ylistrum balloti]